MRLLVVAIYVHVCMLYVPANTHVSNIYWGNNFCVVKSLCFYSALWFFEVTIVYRAVRQFVWGWGFWWKASKSPGVSSWWAPIKVRSRCSGRALVLCSFSSRALFPLVKGCSCCGSCVGCWQILLLWRDRYDYMTMNTWYLWCSLCVSSSASVTLYLCGFLLKSQFEELACLWFLATAMWSCDGR